LRRDRSPSPRSPGLVVAGAAVRLSIRSMNFLTGGHISSATRPRQKRRFSRLTLAGSSDQSWTLGAWPGGMTSRCVRNTRKRSPICFTPIPTWTGCCQKPPAGPDAACWVPDSGNALGRHAYFRKHLSHGATHWKRTPSTALQNSTRYFVMLWDRNCASS
jgi:hypothetical protein